MFNIMAVHRPFHFSNIQDAYYYYYKKARDRVYRASVNIHSNMTVENYYSI